MTCKLLQEHTAKVNISSVLAALKECTASRSLEKGKKIHVQAVQHGLEANRFIAGSLLNMYAKCGAMSDAQTIFDRMKQPGFIACSALATGYVENQQEETALKHISLMDSRGCQPNTLTYVAAVKACTSLATKHSATSEDGKPINLERGARFHFQALTAGCYTDILANTLVGMYSKCGSLNSAYQVFNKMPYHSVVSWNAILLGYAENGEGELAMDLFSRMQNRGCEPNARTFVSVLKACSDLAKKEDIKEVDGKLVKVKTLEKAKAFHARIATSSGCQDSYVSSALIVLYSQCGSTVEAHRVFDRMPQHDCVSLNALLFGYAENGDGELVFNLFSRFAHRATVRTFVAPLKACIDLSVREQGTSVSGSPVKLHSLERGMSVHSLASDSSLADTEIFIASSLVHMYSQCGSMVDARRVFDRMKNHNSVTWNSLILGYVDNCEPRLALECFRCMTSEANIPTFLAVLKACTAVSEKEEPKQVDGKLVRVESLKRGREVHVRARETGLDTDVYVANSLVDMYSSCGSIADARECFEGMTTSRTVVSFNSLMLAYAESKQGDEALDLFLRMKPEGCQPNPLTYAAAMKACGSLVSLELGKAMQGEVRRQGFETDPVLEACTVDFYGKCGSMTDAQLVFDAFPSRDLVKWTALMVGYSRQGDTAEVLQLFHGMQEQRLQADSVTFVCIFTACSHVGLVEKGKRCFELMSSKYGVEPETEHYTCMVDILGRGNRLAEAEALLRSMPRKPSSVTWMTLLAACRKWKNVSVGEYAFESLMKLDVKDSAAYVLMGSIYGSLGMRKEQSRVLAMRRNSKAWKAPERSWWTDHTGKVHAFTAGEDINHPQMEEMNVKLKQLQGYVPEEGREEDDSLCGHSERLAVACALVSTEARSMIRIVKSLRVCEDCHKATAIVSRVEQRIIVCIDINRLHVFRDGSCTCGDVW